MEQINTENGRINFQCRVLHVPLESIIALVVVRNETNPITYLSLNATETPGSMSPCIDQLTELTHLDLRRNRLSGRIPETITKLTQLKLLGLTQNRWNDSPEDALTPNDQELLDHLELRAVNPVSICR